MKNKNGEKIYLFLLFEKLFVFYRYVNKSFNRNVVWVRVKCTQTFLFFVDNKNLIAYYPEGN